MPYCEKHNIEKHRATDRWVCVECRKEWNRSNFKRNREKRRKDSKTFYENNKEKVLKKCKIYRDKNRGKINAQARQYYKDNKQYFVERNRFNKFGVTPEHFNKMMSEQKELCDICGVELKSLDSRHTHIDHCHKTGKVRGVLCTNCNVGIGNLRDDISILKNAIKYLEKI